MQKVGGKEQLLASSKKLQPRQSVSGLGRLGEIPRIQVKVPGRLWGSTEYDFYPATDPSINGIIASEEGRLMSQQPLPTKQAVAEEYWSSLIGCRLEMQNGRVVITGYSIQRQPKSM